MEAHKFLTFLGICLCVAGSVCNTASNAFLKLDADKRKAEYTEAFCSLYRILFFVCVSLGALMDLASIVFLPPTLWAALCCLDTILFKLSSIYLLSHELDYTEILVLLPAVAGSILQAVYGFPPEELTEPAMVVFANHIKDNYIITILVSSMFYITLTTAYLVQRKTMIYRRNNIDEFPLDEMPAPLDYINFTSVYTCSLCTVQFQATLSVTMRSMFHWSIAFSVPLLLPFLYLHLRCLAFLADEGHTQTVVPAGVILGSAMHQLIGWTMYGGRVTNAPLYFTGICLCLSSFVGVYFNMQRLYDLQGADDFTGQKTHRMWTNQSMYSKSMFAVSKLEMISETSRFMSQTMHGLRLGSMRSLDLPEMSGTMTFNKNRPSISFDYGGSSTLNPNAFTPMYLMDFKKQSVDRALKMAKSDTYATTPSTTTTSLKQCETDSQLPSGPEGPVSFTVTEVSTGETTEI